ncbi:uncharacterized protein F5891DRAFT_1130999 [Suillus fuscotomentosus]|uniref:Uncharacterized protein n=1 Tax=Suillus fuscotomentosus TaxID=1912939 RepID=A0AAD4DWN2_9AGAM|nr:uncharacterized protein F5891DRAFT_1130999 [Suillus fuscotomentosus]KAG1894244.1 hypothetical protein F5891DRAFT_1130999 [Suillus fuscotomentosus]
MHPSELDARIRVLPPCFEVCHFQNGWTVLSQISGRERKEMVCILLGCLVGKVPRQVILAYRSLLDFIYLAQYPTHDDQTLSYLQDALDMFHKHKGVLIELGVRDHFNIPKIHSLTHYINSIRLFGAMDNYNTEAFERLHIDFAKDAWRATNKREECPQMTSLEMTQLPFDKLDIYHGFKFVLEELGEDEVDSSRQTDWIKACPKTHGSHGQKHFDTVVAMRTDECQATGVQGKIGRLRLLFKLPQQWYTMLKNVPEKEHCMYEVKKMPLRSGNVVPADIIPISTICQTCQLIPCFGTADVSREWRSENVLDLCDRFLLNNWSTKYAYKTLY